MMMTLTIYPVGISVVTKIPWLDLFKRLEKSFCFLFFISCWVVEYWWWEGVGWPIC